MHELTMMDIRVDESRREIVGVVAPYDETTYLVPIPGGERMRRGCFKKSIADRGDRVPLTTGHNHGGPILGHSVAWRENPDGLVGTFKINPGPKGDELLTEARDGYWPAMSVGFEALDWVRGADGAQEVTAARLHEVSLVGVGAYAGAGVLAGRAGDDLEAQRKRQRDALLAPFQKPPRVDLTPLPPIWLR
jgi:HK97 family phage prohead protease